MGLDALVHVLNVAKAELLGTVKDGYVVLGCQIQGCYGREAGVKIRELLMEGKKLGSITHQGVGHGSHRWNWIAIMAEP